MRSDDRPMSPTPRRILVVDDHDGFRAAASTLLAAAGYVVVGEAVDGPTALEQARLLRPDVLLLDIQLPGVDGFAVAEELATAQPRLQVVLVSSHDAEAYGERLTSAPVAGFLAKSHLSGDALAELLDPP
jgi:DNA-binding NarL/FixJ family response regulator